MRIVTQREESIIGEDVNRGADRGSAAGAGISIQEDRDLAKTSHYRWMNIEVNGTRVGKMRVGLGKGRLVIYSVIIFSQFVRQGYGREVVRALKQEYREILADRVRDTAKGFWRKMGFRADGKGNYAWQSEPG